MKSAKTGGSSRALHLKLVRVHACSPLSVAGFAFYAWHAVASAKAGRFSQKLHASFILFLLPFSFFLSEPSFLGSQRSVGMMTGFCY